MCFVVYAKAIALPFRKKYMKVRGRNIQKLSVTVILRREYGPDVAQQIQNVLIARSYLAKSWRKVVIIADVGDFSSFITTKKLLITF